jgi:Lrp/AsnC family leucine-responsive transcriptional regulator
MLRKLQYAEHRIDLVLDELDRQILYHWDLNCRRSATEIAKLVKSNKETVNFRMKRMLSDGIITSTMTELNNSKFGYNNIKVYFQFRNFTKELETEFFDYLKAIKEVGWVVSCSGRWDALFCYWAKSQYEFHQAFLKMMQRFGKHILHKEIISNINWFYYNRKWLIKEFTEPLAIKYGGEPGNQRLDALDKNMLVMLAKDGRKPVVDIANELKTSSQNVINRMRKLESDGIITKYSININHDKIGYIFCKAFVYLENTTQERLDDLYKHCAAQPNIFALTTTLGAWDLELEFEVENFEQMTRAMDDIKIKFSDIITNYESVIITHQITPMYMD